MLYLQKNMARKQPMKQWIVGFFLQNLNDGTLETG